MPGGIPCTHRNLIGAPHLSAAPRRSRQRFSAEHAPSAYSLRTTIGDHGGILAMQQHRILIADDELDVQMLLSLFFERQGHTIIRARDGQEAVSAASSQLPDLILMDIQMPRKTGIEAVQELRADPRFA